MIKLHLFAITAAEAYVNRLEASLSLKLLSSSSSSQPAISASVSSSSSSSSSSIDNNDTILSTPIRSKSVMNGNHLMMSPLQKQVFENIFLPLL